MTRRIPAALAFGCCLLLAVAGCSANDAPSGSAGPTGNPRASRPVTLAPTVEPASPAAGSPATVAGSPDPSICVETRDAAVVVVTVEDFSFEPADVEAEVGEVITFMNAGFESHNATLDSGACAIPTIETAERDGLLFMAPGRYSFHCSVHTWMTGTLEIAPSDEPSEPAAAVPGRGDRSVVLDQEQRGA